MSEVSMTTEGYGSKQCVETEGGKDAGVRKSQSLEGWYACGPLPPWQTQVARISRQVPAERAVGGSGQEMGGGVHRDSAKSPPDNLQIGSPQSFLSSACLSALWSRHGCTHLIGKPRPTWGKKICTIRVSEGCREHQDDGIPFLGQNFPALRQTGLGHRALGLGVFLDEIWVKEKS